MIWVWNLRISYPDLPIYLCDDDIKNAFRLIKHNPAVVSYNAYGGHGYLAFATGQTFGGNYTPQNFDPPAESRTQHAKYCWLHRHQECEKKIAAALQDVKTKAMDADIPSDKANADSLNRGVFDERGEGLPTEYTGHVDDNVYGEIE